MRARLIANSGDIIEMALPDSMVHPIAFLPVLEVGGSMNRSDAPLRRFRLEFVSAETAVYFQDVAEGPCA